jgi:hypothetical protein
MSNPIYQFKYPPIDTWKALWDSSINPTKPSYYAMQQNADGSQTLTVSGPAVTGDTGSGALLQGLISAPPSIPFTSLTTSLTVMVDNSPARQWLEIDTRITMPDGYTYPGDLDIGLDGTIRVGDMTGGWHVTPVKIGALKPWVIVPISILKTYDFTKRVSTLVSIQLANMSPYPINQTFPAANLGWDGFIVEQHQIDQAASGGICMAVFGPTVVSGS